MACLGRVDIIGAVSQQVLSDSNKVHDLGNAKERGNNQGPATGPLQEGPGTLLSQDLSAKEKRGCRVDNVLFILNLRMHNVRINLITSVENQRSICFTILPYAVHHSIVRLLISSFFE